MVGRALWEAVFVVQSLVLLAGVVSVPSRLLFASAPPFASRRVVAPPPLPQLMQTGVELLGRAARRSRQLLLAGPSCRLRILLAVPKLSRLASPSDEPHTDKPWPLCIC